MTTKPMSSIPVAAMKRAEEKTRSMQQDAAAKAAEQLAKQRDRRARAGMKVPPENMIYYYRCPDCNGPGIWLKGSAKGKNGMPLGILTEDMWWSSYHDLGDPYPSKDIICQCCYAEKGPDDEPLKRRVTLRFDHTNKQPIIKQRWIGPTKEIKDPVTGNVQEWCVPRGYTPDEFETLCKGGDPFEEAGEVNHD